MNEEIYTVCPTSPIRKSKIESGDILLSQGLDLNYEFTAAIKERFYSEEVIHIFGRLNQEWEKNVEAAYEQKKDIEMPLIIQGETFIAGYSTMQK